MMDKIYENVIAGNREGVLEGVRKALEGGHDANEILNQALIAAMDEVGRRFEQGAFFVPEMLIAARAMKEGLVVLRPHLAERDVKPVGKVVIGTVQGDLHDIGKNLVGMMFEGGGFEVIDLGVDVPSERFVEAVAKHRPDFVGMSALLTTTMQSIPATIDALTESGLREGVMIMVGGAPLTEQFAEEIGADLFAPDAASAVGRAKELLLTN